MRREKAAYLRVLVPLLLVGVLFALLRFSSSHYEDCDTHQSCITCQTLSTPAPRPPPLSVPKPRVIKATPLRAPVGGEMVEAQIFPPQERAPPC